MLRPGPSPATMPRPASARFDPGSIVIVWRVQQLAEIAALAPFLYLLAALYALMRQLLAWRRSWQTYGRCGTTLWRKNERTHSGHPWHYVRCAEHQHLPLDVREYLLARDDDIVLRGRVVVPGPVGNNLWSYVASDGDSIGRLSWVWTCFRLFLVRRFAESEIEACSGCSSRAARLLDEIRDALNDGHAEADH